MRERAEATNALCIAQPTFAMGDIERKEAVNRGVIVDVPTVVSAALFVNSTTSGEAGRFYVSVSVVWSYGSLGSVRRSLRLSVDARCRHFNA